jgi:hypothetical protein
MNTLNPLNKAARISLQVTVIALNFKHVCGPSTWEAEARGSLELSIGDQCGPHSETPLKNKEPKIQAKLPLH